MPVPGRTLAEHAAEWFRAGGRTAERYPTENSGSTSAPWNGYRQAKRLVARNINRSCPGKTLVGVGRFELPASSSRTKRAAKLRHTPATAYVL